MEEGEQSLQGTALPRPCLHRKYKVGGPEGGGNGGAPQGLGFLLGAAGSHGRDLRMGPTGAIRPTRPLGGPAPPRRLGMVCAGRGPPAGPIARKGAGPRALAAGQSSCFFGILLRAPLLLHWAVPGLFLKETLAAPKVPALHQAVYRSLRTGRTRPRPKSAGHSGFMFSRASSPSNTVPSELLSGGQGSPCTPPLRQGLGGCAPYLAGGGHHQQG